jgi:hypothetical protein
MSAADLVNALQPGPSTGHWSYSQRQKGDGRYRGIPEAFIRGQSEGTKQRRIEW